MKWLPINYRDYWDVPRVFVVEYKGRTFLFNCPFDDDEDDYPEEYRVYEVDYDLHEFTDLPWDAIPGERARLLAVLPVNCPSFADSKPRTINPDIFTSFLETHI